MDKTSIENWQKVKTALEKANKNNIVHHNKVSRKKSRCAELISTL